jgi:Zn-dependent protease
MRVARYCLSVSPPPLVQSPTLTAEPELSPSHPQRPKGKGVGAAIGGALLVVLAKAKVLLVGLKALKLGKILLSMGSMVAMIWYEAVLGGWLFGVGFVLLLLIHELGHGYEIKRAGLAAGYPVFIPFFGALIALKEQPRSPLQEARIAFAGPVWGAAGSLATAALYLATHQRLFLSLAYTGFFLNLFNLTPLGFLDGGRVTRVFSRHAWILGLVIFAGLFIATQTPQLLLIGIMALMNVFQRQPADPASIPAPARAGVAARYLGLCGGLAAGAAFCRLLLHSGAG